MAGDATSSGTFYYDTVGDFKKILFISDGTVCEGQTIDLGTDSAGGRINDIQAALAVSEDGTLVVNGTTISGTTGIITITAIPGQRFLVSWRSLRTWRSRRRCSRQLSIGPERGI